MLVRDMQVNPFDILSGLVARDEWGTYWFKEPGNNMLNAGMPIEKNLHRAGAPAIEWRNGCKDWYYNGVKHRMDGPAHEPGDDDYSDNEWYIKGEELSEEDFNAHLCK